MNMYWHVPQNIHFNSTQNYKLRNVNYLYIPHKLSNNENFIVNSNKLEPFDIQKYFDSLYHTLYSCLKVFLNKDTQFCKVRMLILLLQMI